MTEVTAGSGLYGPTLFDAYRAFDVRPAALFALPVVRKPSPASATVLGGGYLASGAAGADRLPRPVLPAGLRLDRAEGAGEVQTPVLGAGGARPRARRPGVVSSRQGRRAVRALRRPAPRARRGDRRRGGHLPRRGADLPVSIERREARRGRGRRGAGRGRDARRPGHRVDRALPAAGAGRARADAALRGDLAGHRAAWPTSSGSSSSRSRRSTRSTSPSTAPTRSAPDGWVIKGGGGAHTREKVVAAASARFVVIASSDKVVDALGPPVPLELLSFGLPATLRLLGEARVRPATPPLARRRRHRRLPRRLRRPARAGRAARPRSPASSSTACSRRRSSATSSSRAARRSSTATWWRHDGARRAVRLRRPGDCRSRERGASVESCPPTPASGTPSPTCTPSAATSSSSPAAMAPTSGTRTASATSTAPRACGA